jgi:hypothetical protein
MIAENKYIDTPEKQKVGHLSKKCLQPKRLPIASCCRLSLFNPFWARAASYRPRHRVLRGSLNARPRFAGLRLTPARFAPSREAERPVKWISFCPHPLKNKSHCKLQFAVASDK